MLLRPPLLHFCYRLFALTFFSLLFLLFFGLHSSIPHQINPRLYFIVPYSLHENNVFLAPRFHCSSPAINSPYAKKCKPLGVLSNAISNLPSHLNVLRSDRFKYGNFLCSIAGKSWLHIAPWEESSHALLLAIDEVLLSFCTAVITENELSRPISLFFSRPIGTTKDLEIYAWLGSSLGTCKT